MMIFRIRGNIVDVVNRNIYPGEISFEKGIITEIKKLSGRSENYILPGFVDSHIHVESSMLTPRHFSRIAVSHGTVAVVSDPHEIANVLGLPGILYFIQNAKSAKIKFYFGAPSCVPATAFESSGASITAQDIELLFKDYKLKFLSEMMNYPGVIMKDKSVMEKINVAKKYDVKIDGHAPGLTGKKLDRYIQEGISTDHECLSYEEAVEKIKKGMSVQIREGSAAKNFIALEKLIDRYPDKVFLCSDDLHPNDLIRGHINKLLKLGVERKIELFNLLRSATINPVEHYNLNVGLLREGDPADFIVMEDIKEFNVIQTYIDGEIAYRKDMGLARVYEKLKPNKFVANKVIPGDLRVPAKGGKVKVINAYDGDLITSLSVETLTEVNGCLQSWVDKDILKLIVLNRYKISDPAIAFIKNFGLKSGAIASSIAHDSHNLIAVGVNDQDLCECMNWIIEQKGGIAVFDGKKITGIPLPIGGIISDKPVEFLSEQYEKLNSITLDLGCKLKSPFMTLSFMSLLVIPDLKLSDKGLFDVKKFKLTSLYLNNEGT